MLRFSRVDNPGTNMRTPGQISIQLLALGLFAALHTPPAEGFFDQDADGVTDTGDNCTLVANPRQIDSNADGFGNACDADLNDDGIVDDTDRQLLYQFSADNNLDADFNGDGYIGNWDLAILNDQIGSAPGPSGRILVV